MSKITSIEGLVKALSMCVGESCVLDIMSMVEIPITEYERYFSWNPERQTRNLLAKTDAFEVVLVCWEKGQQSPIHDFDFKESWVHPIVGELREERFLKASLGLGLNKVQSVLLGTNEFSYIKQVGIHRYTNTYESRSVSLHIYSEPVNQWRVYSEETGFAEMQETKYDKIFHIATEDKLIS